MILLKLLCSDHHFFCLYLRNWSNDYLWYYFATYICYHYKRGGSYHSHFTDKKTEAQRCSVTYQSQIHVCMLYGVLLFETPWTVAHQASLSMGFSRQEYCSGLPFSTLENLPNPGIKPESPELAGMFFISTQGKPIKVK